MRIHKYKSTFTGYGSGPRSTIAYIRPRHITSTNIFLEKIEDPKLDVIVLEIDTDFKTEYGYKTHRLPFNTVEEAEAMADLIQQDINNMDDFPISRGSGDNNINKIIRT